MLYISHSPEETIACGESFASTHLQCGAVITVRGELGAGKTHFIKGVAHALGIPERELTSPTFALVNEYEAMLLGKSISLFHLDCYRFENAEELLELGVEDYLHPKHAITIVEWPERIESLLPRTAMNVRIEIISENERNITY